MTQLQATSAITRCVLDQSRSLPAFVPEQLGHYRLIRPLGRGGMGLLFLAEDMNLARRVAIKIMKPEVAANQNSRERFLREARAAAAIHNEHVVTVYHVGEDHKTPFIAMELLRGKTLEEYLKGKPKLPVSLISRLGREIAEGLAGAHERGLIHRDIKPANIWLEVPKGHVKLLDFGLAQATAGDDRAEKLTEDGYVLGTPEFMSPEQARGQTLDQRCDLFSLGAILYLLCTGRGPFDGPGLTATMTALIVDKPKPVAELNPLVPVALSDLIDRLLEKQPAKRPESAKEVAAELRALELGHSKLRKLPKPNTRPAKPRRRSRQTSRWAFVGAGVVLLFVLGILTAAAFMPETPAREYSVILPAPPEKLRENGPYPPPKGKLYGASRPGPETGLPHRKGFGPPYPKRK